MTTNNLEKEIQDLWNEISLLNPNDPEYKSKLALINEKNSIIDKNKLMIKSLKDDINLQNSLIYSYTHNF